MDRHRSRDSCRTLDQPLEIGAEDLLDFVRSVGAELVQILERLGHAFGMRKVAAEEHPLDRELASQRLDIVLIERRDVDMALELLARMRLERLRHLAMGAIQSREQRRHPVGAILDRGHAHPGMPFEYAMADESGDRVRDGSAEQIDHRFEWIAFERQELAPLAAGPPLGDPVVAAVGSVHTHEDAGVRDARPEGVVFREAEGAAAADVGHRRRADRDRARTVSDHEVELGQSQIQVGRD